jgi:gliding motility-associated-like protein
MKYIQLLIFSIVFCISGSAQQANNWYFGFNAGITFNTPVPTALLDGALFATEGCSSISDNNGRILFYTDGITVYDRTHQPMPNGTGLLGGSSSANAAMIIPQPGSDGIYYIFTSDDTDHYGSSGYNFSVVDMSLNNGKGDITLKNQLLYAPGCEQLSAVRHANGLDIWVITKVYASDEWRVFKVDCNGIDTRQVSSFSGLPSVMSVGNLKTSHDGKKMAFARWDMDLFELYDFDNATGTISNPIAIQQTWASGLEFSLDSKLLYVSGGRLVQYDISTSNETAIRNSAITLYTPSHFNHAIGALQLGPDGKIYWAIGGAYTVGVINHPDLPGTACDLQPDQLDLQGRMVVSSFGKIFSNLITNKTADFSFTINSDCSRVDFAANSSISGNLTFNWDFGDGQTATGQQVSHTYASNAANVNKVKLTVISVYPCYAVVTKELNLERLTATAKFDATYTCGNLEVQLSDESFVSGGSVASWHWNFGDGNESYEQSPRHRYTTTGEYTITLSVSSGGVCSHTDQLQEKIALEAKPVALFNNDPACAGKPVQLHDASTITAGNITDWKWIFDDGSSAMDANPVKTFMDAGDYPVKMVAKSATGCISDTLYKTITVNDIPKAGFSVTDTCFAQHALFHGDASVNNGSIQQWWWQIDGNEITNLQDPSWIFSQPGEYTVKLIATANTACASEVVERSVFIQPKPEARIDVEDGCTQSALKVLNTSTVDAGKIISGLWDFGNGEVRQGLNPDYSYSTAGTYRIAFKAVSEVGCVSDPVEEVVQIEATPVVDFAFNATCAGKEIDFMYQPADVVGAGEKIQWTFGNGVISSELSPSYTYNRYGVYPVTLKHTTVNGCTASKTKNVIIERTTIHAGNDTIAATGQPVQLRATGAQTYQWSPSLYLNDPRSANPIATPQRDITYYLTGVTAQGCIGYDTLQIKAYRGPAIYVPNAFTPSGNHRIFRPVLVGITELRNFSVYNRWGQMIFTTKEFKKGWDGTVNGQQQPAGTYVWTIQAIDYLGKLHQEKGTVTLIR